VSSFLWIERKNRKVRHSLVKGSGTSLKKCQERGGPSSTVGKRYGNWRETRGTLKKGVKRLRVIDLHLKGHLDRGTPGEENMNK